MAETAQAIFEETDLNTRNLPLVELLPALKRLDTLLEQAIAAAHQVYGPEAASDLYRGLYINQAEVKRLLIQAPGDPAFPMNGTLADLHISELNFQAFPARLIWLRQAYDLSIFDLDVMLIALAPELDRRYERLYAFLQDHVSRRRPSVDLVLNLLCPHAASRLQHRSHFDPNAPLIRHGLIHLLPGTDHAYPSLLTYTLRLDEQIVRFLLHEDNPDARLATFCQYIKVMPHQVDGFVDNTLTQKIAVLINNALENEQPLRLYFHDPHGIDKHQTAVALASQLDQPLLSVDLVAMLAQNQDFPDLLRLVFRSARFYNVILYMYGLDALSSDEQIMRRQQLFDGLKEAQLTILAGTQPWQSWQSSMREPIGMIPISFGMPDHARRKQLWQAHLTNAEISIANDALETLSNRLRLSPHQIAEAIAVACASTTHKGQPTFDDLFAAARAQCGHALASLARKIEPIYTWDDIVLPADSLAQLRELCQRVAHRQRVFDMWGFRRKLSLGMGANALFAGPSGTGKTMAAEIIARELGLDMYKIDLSGVVSKYIGETEKNLNRIFAAAGNANAILFFDEADALFGKRSEVRDSHDRYANIEISYLLQKMEEYDGLAILATNLRQNLDEAFIRRLAFTVHFPFPDEASRCQIWAGIWPTEMPMAQDIAHDMVAHRFKLSGGNIKNVALAAAFLAAEAGEPVRMPHLLKAVRREYQKMGKPLGEADLADFTAQGDAHNG